MVGLPCRRWRIQGLKGLYHGAERALRTVGRRGGIRAQGAGNGLRRASRQDRKSTRLNARHLVILYAVFCLKEKKKITPQAELWTELGVGVRAMRVRCR